MHCSDYLRRDQTIYNHSGFLFHSIILTNLKNKKNVYIPYYSQKFTTVGDI